MQFIEISVEDYYYFYFEICIAEIMSKSDIQYVEDATHAACAIDHICVFRFISSFALIECHRWCVFSYWLDAFFSLSREFHHGCRIKLNLLPLCHTNPMNIILLITRLAKCDLHQVNVRIKEWMKQNKSRADLCILCILCILYCRFLWTTGVTNSCRRKRKIVLEYYAVRIHANAFYIRNSLGFSLLIR